MFDLIYPQPPAIPPRSLLLYLSRTCSVFAPLRFRHFPRRSFVTTLLSLLILIDTTSRARVCPRQLSSPSFFIPHYPPGCITSARLYASNAEVALLPVPLHSSLFVNSRRITLLHVSVPLSECPECQSASLTTSLWLSRISLRIFALDIG